MAGTDFFALLADHAAKDSPAVPVVFGGTLPVTSVEVETMLRRIDAAEEGYHGPSASTLLYDALMLTRGHHDARSMWRRALRSIDAAAEAAGTVRAEAEAAAVRFRVQENVGGTWMHHGPAGQRTVEQAEESAASQRALFPGRAFRVVDDRTGEVVRDYYPEVVLPPSGSQRTAPGWKREYYKVDKTSTGKYSISCEVQVLDGSRFATDEEQDAYVEQRLAAINAVCRREVKRQEDLDAAPF